MKVVINRCYGGFSLSKAAVQFMIDRGNVEAIEESKKGYWYGYLCGDDRANPDLVAAVEFLGEEKASGDYAKVVVIEIPDGVDYEISECDGMECVRERSRAWY